MAPPREPEPFPARDDPRLQPFAAVVGRRRGALAVVEGAIPTRRACAAGLPVEVVLCTASHVDALREFVPAETMWWVASKAELSSLLGYAFHRGVVASVRVPAPSAVPQVELRDHDAPLIAVAVGLTDPANIGTLVRAARAFDVAHVIVDAAGADPFARKAIRGSAGHVFSMGLTISADPLDAVLQLREALGAELLALTPAGVCSLRTLTERRARIVAFGSEGPGLPSAWLEAADQRVRIPLADGVDSLNVASSAAVTFYALTHRP